MTDPRLSDTVQSELHLKINREVTLMHATPKHAQPKGRHMKPKERSPHRTSRRRNTFGLTLMAALLTLVFGAPTVAQAGDDNIGFDIVRGNTACDEVVVESSGKTSYDNARVVIDDGTTVHIETVGSPVSIGPFDSPTTVHYRYFNGPERDGDIPLWDGHPSFNPTISNYIESNGTGWILGGFDDPNPFVTWNSFDIDGCITPEEPEFTHPVCVDDATTEPGLADIPEQTGVTYDPAENQELDHGDFIVVEAAPTKGYVFPRDADTKWTFLPVTIPCDGEDGQNGEDGQDGSDGSDGEDGQDGEVTTVTEVVEIEVPTRINTGR